MRRLLALLIVSAIGATTAPAPATTNQQILAARMLSGQIIQSLGDRYHYVYTGLTAIIVEAAVGDHGPAEYPSCVVVHQQYDYDHQAEDRACGLLSVEIDPVLMTGRATGTIPSDLGAITVDVTLTTDPTRRPAASPFAAALPPPNAVAAAGVRVQRFGLLSGTIASSAIGGNTRDCTSWPPLDSFWCDGYLEHFTSAIYVNWS